MGRGEACFAAASALAEPADPAGAASGAEVGAGAGDSAGALSVATGALSDGAGPESSAHAGAHVMTVPTPNAAARTPTRPICLPRLMCSFATGWQRPVGIRDSLWMAMAL